jgi:hypothetical protein
MLFFPPSLKEQANLEPVSQEYTKFGRWTGKGDNLLLLDVAFCSTFYLSV